VNIFPIGKARGGMMNAQEKYSEISVNQESTPQSLTSNFQKIIVAVDRQSATVRLIEKAMQLAQANGSSLMLFHSILEEIPGIAEISSFAGMGGGYNWTHTEEMLQIKEQNLQELIQEIEAWLGDLCQRAKARGIPAQFSYHIGNPGQQICKQAKEWGADIIVIGRRGLTGLSEIFLGSVSNYVVHHAHCSVLIIQEPVA
jgi:nucleotide-binding universal stress UspA family protein